MSRLLSEKRIISVDTVNTAANAFDDGACVIDATNNAIKVSDGTAWTQLAIGTVTAVTYEALDASGDIDTNLSSAAANTVPSSAAVKSYVDGKILGLATELVYGAGTAIGATGMNEIGVIGTDCALDPTDIMTSGTVAEVYNYSARTLTITASSGNINDVQAGTVAATISIVAGQCIKFVPGRDNVAAYRSL